MIEKWFEAFTLLERLSTPDAAGGEIVAFSDVTGFRGALTLSAGSEISAAGQALLREDPVLLHEFDVTLTVGDYVRREKDQAIFRVSGRSDNLRSPAFSGLRFAQVPVERVVLPC